MPVDLLGRDELLGRLGALVDSAWAGDGAAVLVAGPAGIGKTSLLRESAARAAGRGGTVAWGGCIDLVDAPGYWPWTQLLGALTRVVGADRARELAGADAPLLATIAPVFGTPAGGEDSDRARLLLMDATVRWFAALAAQGPVLVILDDLQWADESSMQLLEFVAGSPRAEGLCVIGAYRGDEVNPRIRHRMGALLAHVEHLVVGGLDADAVHTLVERVAARPVDRSVSLTILRRAGGHPFFTRELALLLGSDRDADIPAVVRDAIDRRLAELPAQTQVVLETAAVIGPELLPDVLAEVVGCPPDEIAAAVRSAADVLAQRDGTVRFAHDLLRETLLARIEPARRTALHRAIGAALADRQVRAGDVAPAQLAAHFTAAIGPDGPGPATRWVLAAAAADRAALAFDEAAGRLRRLRGAVADAGTALPDDDLVEVLLAEADALTRAGKPVDARGLLRLARDVASRQDDPAQVGRVALAHAALGARFASRRDEIVTELEHALEAVTGSDDVMEARLTATLARELAHSVAADRPRAGPLSQRALTLGRRSGDPETVASCLLARHDVLWTPGAAGDRAVIASEIAALAQRSGDQERQAQGLLLQANALLEDGSSAFEAVLDECLAILDQLGQPRHRYTAETRRACVALLQGRLDEAHERIEHAAELGERIREPDTGNVRMSQRLELVRARGEAGELRAFADEAVAHWVEAPIHAHAVAAGFRARAGDLDAARRHLTTVHDLGSWQADRSYLWSVFVRELAQAAVLLADRDLCAKLFTDVEPVAGTCGVNGALVAFAGSHAQTAALLAEALGRDRAAADYLEAAGATYRRLGAAGFLAELRPAPGSGGAGRSLRRRDGVWHLRFDGEEATVPHAKGLSDIARLIASGEELHVLDLADPADRSGAAGELVDRTALASYRRRLADLDAELAVAAEHHDHGRAELLGAERSALLDELGRVTGIGNRRRQFANHPTERARKAVAARIRDAIRRLEPAAPALAAHLARTVVTGTYCRYRPDPGATWEIDP